MWDWLTTQHIDWAVVLATIVGPLAAVGITLWHQERSATRLARRELFVSMMRSRRHLTSVVFVDALNLVPVHFYADKSVMARYAELMATLSNVAWNIPSAVPQLNQNVDTNAARLLSAMSIAVGRPVQQIDILQGAYAPKGWFDQETITQDLHSGLRDLIRGRSALPVYVANQTNEASSSQIEKPPSEQPVAAHDSDDSSVPPLEKPEPDSTSPAA